MIQRACVTAAFVVLAGWAGHASAATKRAWVSGHGVDQAGCGSPASPCRSLQYAHDNAVDAGGEIDILDPAGYGAIAITKSISIVNDGVGTAGVQATSGSAITVAAGVTDAVYLRGLSIDGVQRTGGFGISLSSAGSLTIVNCVIRHFASQGALLQPAGGVLQLLIKDSDFSDNGLNGLLVSPTGAGSARGALDHDTASNNVVAGFLIAGGATTGSNKLTITNSLAANNGTGFSVQSNIPNTVLTLDSSTATANATGVAAAGNGALHLSRSVINQNLTTGVLNATTPSGAAISSGDNKVHGNPTDVSGTLLTEPDV